MVVNIGNDLKSNEFKQGEVKSQKILTHNHIMGSQSIKKYLQTTGKFEIHSVRMFSLTESLQSQKRTYLLQFDEQLTNYVAAEIKLKNPNFNLNPQTYNGLTIWYLEDEEVGRNPFTITLNSDWKYVEFVQSWGTPLPGFWKQGEGRLEILFDNELILKQVFQIGVNEVVDFSIDENTNDSNLNTQITQQPKKIEQIEKTNFDNISMDSLFVEFEGLIGLKNLKTSLKDFITYLNFVSERRKQGIETDEKIFANSIFLGNPGTGKTTVARLLGKFFKSIGLLEYGHVIEVDRAELIGEYIGETAQKTEKVINQALGGILFIDEAYSLKREKTGKDFGQEAIDIILKRMEDYKGKFFVIAAGYPTPMQNFLESNPGLRSRFTHIFNFDNYSPEELTSIFKIFAEKEKYIISSDADEFLLLKLETVCSTPDETFGNARFIRNLFNETKIELSKRYQTLNDDEKDFSALNTILRDDVQSAFINLEQRNNSLNSDERKVDKYISEVNNLVGLEEVKNSFNKILASVKVDKLKKDRSIASIPKNLNSIFIAEAGSGTTTVARLFAKSLKESGRLSKGQLIEIDSSAFYGLSKIDAYLMMDELSKKLLGNVILVNDTVAALQCTSDFSDSLLQYFLKKLYIISDDVVAILTGTNEEIESLINDFPVLENQFPNKFYFEPYTTRQLLEIAFNLCQKKNYQLDEGAWQQLFELIEELRSEKRKNFYNGRTIKDILNKAISFQEDRILSIEKIKDNDLMLITFEDLTKLRSTEV